jgi:hypothetical protein
MLWARQIKVKRSVFALSFWNQAQGLSLFGTNFQGEEKVRLPQSTF